MVLFKTSTKTFGSRQKVFEIWSGPKHPRKHLVHDKKSLKYEKMNCRTMDKLSSRFLVATLKYSSQPHGNTNRIKFVSLKLFTDRMTRKSIIRLIYTQEQLLINFRVTLLNFIMRKNKNQCEIQDSS